MKANAENIDLTRGFDHRTVAHLPSDQGSRLDLDGAIRVIAAKRVGEIKDQFDAAIGDHRLG